LQSIIKFSILITTKNRLDDLKITLSHLTMMPSLYCVRIFVYDDGSSDGTSNFVKSHYPQYKLLRNKKSRGYIFCRNYMLNIADCDYAISLDDDANFISEDILKIIESYFMNNPKCGVIAPRIFWGKLPPSSLESNESPKKVKGFVGCGHIWNLKAWKDIPNYPEWFVFYGEEDFASFQLFKKKWEVHYLPQVLIHHRVDVKTRKLQSDYTIRLRRSLRAGWYLFILFMPISKIPKKMVYSIWMQFKLKVFKGDLKALKAILLALWDLIFNFYKLMKNKNTLTTKEYKEYLKIDDTKIYWEPLKK
jgi:glycosyltransferase involved in cell wall biosynthesis